MEVGDLIFEGVTNSREAGAKNILVNVWETNGLLKVEIEDDGVFQDSKDIFKAGFSTKGAGRGQGLAFIKAVDNGAKLEREGAFTLLSFAALDDGSLHPLENFLFPLFQGQGTLIFHYQKERGKPFEIISEENPTSIKAIASFKAQVRRKELEMSKLTLSDLHAIRDVEQEKLKKRDIHGRNIHVVVAMGTSGINAGAKVVLNTIADELDKAGCENVILTQSGSALPNPEPLVEVYSEELGLVAYGAVSKDDAIRIVKEHIINGKVVSDKVIELKEEE